MSGSGAIEDEFSICCTPDSRAWGRMPYCAGASPPIAQGFVSGDPYPAEEYAAERAKLVSDAYGGAIRGPFQLSRDSLESRKVPQWFEDAKYGRMAGAHCRTR